jgi:ribosomal protein S18 acetylase RimI-like enzyme
VTALAGLAASDAVGALAELVRAGEHAGLLLDDDPLALPAALVEVDEAPVLQMIHEADNARAIALYERAGFRAPRLFRYLIVRRR